MKPVHGWTDVVDEPYAGKVPPLPKCTRATEGQDAPEPERPLGRMGLAVWERTFRGAGSVAVDTEALLVLCEQMDERVALRVRVLKNPDDWRTRTALRAVDQQILTGLSSLGIASARTIPVHWPAMTKRWWRAISRMPHCVLWSAADWEFAQDTALIAAAFHAGDARVAAELRQREKILGTTVDARRDLRIRYVDSIAEPVDSSAVTVMDNYRRLASGHQTG